MAPEEFEKHMITHLPYSACPHCLVAKQTSQQHKIPCAERQLQHVVAGYAHVRDPFSETAPTTLVVDLPHANFTGLRLSTLKGQRQHMRNDSAR